jgi:hypothetical protein
MAGPRNAPPPGPRGPGRGLPTAEGGALGMDGSARARARKADAKRQGCLKASCG